MVKQSYTSLEAYLYDLVHQKKHTFWGKCLLMVLRFFSWIYGLGVWFKQSFYAWGLIQPHVLPCLVISLGNITVGGTGKTPTAQKLAEVIRNMGYNVAILNRGYRAQYDGDVGLVSDGRRIYMTVNEAGDEAYLLAKSVPGVSVVIGRNRFKSGEFAFDKLKADVLILDDGYQHWQLHRDLDIVLIDSLNRFGNSFLLPRGTLREPLVNLKRAHAFLLTKVDQSKEEDRRAIKEVLHKYHPEALVVESVHHPQSFIEIEEWYKGVRPQHVPLEQLRHKKVLAISAIGNPASFEQTISDLGAYVEDKVRYPDHHNYSMVEMQYILSKAEELEVDAMVTTEKDAVKIPSEFIYSNRNMPFYVLGIEVKFMSGCTGLMELVQNMTEEKRRFLL